MAGHSALPIELYRFIFQLLPSNDLVTLCCISKVFRDESETLLYRHVDLHNSDIFQILSWCGQVVEHPHLSRFVSTLCLPCTLPMGQGEVLFRQRAIAAKQSNSFSKFLASITHRFRLFSTENAPGEDYEDLLDMISAALCPALKVVVNLVTLIIQPTTRRGYIFRGYLRPEMFTDCTFRLKTLRDFGSTFMGPEYLIPFLSHQADIHDWQAGVDFEHSKSGLDPPIPSDLLPKLTITHLTYQPYQAPVLLRFMASRPLVRLGIHMKEVFIPQNEVGTIMRVLSPCVHTLTHLDIRLDLAWQDSFRTPADTLGLIADCLPGLIDLAYMELYQTYQVFSAFQFFNSHLMMLSG